MDSKQQNEGTKMARLVLMAGAAGSGKSYVRKNAADLRDLPVVDADSFKAAHPDYNPKDPGALHVWSSEKANEAFYASLATGTDFIYDGTGTKAEKYVKMIREAKAAGFTTEIVYVRVTLETSLERNANRERNVPVAIVHEQHELLPTAIEIISREADKMRTVDNDL